tara:strand:- start:1787 stop:2539 length:753 start_codon:yes stop_codon:yes gene_type:complete
MSNVVFMVNIKNDDNPTRVTPYEYSINSWKKWCDKNDSELFVLDQYIHEPNYSRPNWYKLYVFDLLEANEIDYDQILVVDSDTIVHPDCPNFFELSENKFCAVHNDGSYDWVCRSLENYSKHLFDGFTFPLWEYFNSGFLIMNKSHRDFYKKIIKFYLENRDFIVKLQDTFGVGTDQPVINFFVHKENIDLKLLPYRFNMQDMFRKEILGGDMLFTKVGWVYHFNAIPNNVDSKLTVEWMKRTYEYFYGS